VIDAGRGGAGRERIAQQQAAAAAHVEQMIARPKR